MDTQGTSNSSVEYLISCNCSHLFRRLEWDDLNYRKVDDEKKEFLIVLAQN